MQWPFKQTGSRQKALLFCGVLLCILLTGHSLHAKAVKLPPEGCTLRKEAPAADSCFPLETAAWRVSDSYGWRLDPLTGKEAFHRGIDLACETGTAVRAAMDGVVVIARTSKSYGNYLRLCHASGQETLYAHMQYLYVRTGEIVRAGQRLGTVGQTGRATGAHLHFELLSQGIHCDPSKILKLP